MTKKLFLQYGKGNFPCAMS